MAQPPIPESTAYHALRMLTLTLMDGHVRNVVNLNYDIYTSFTILSGVREGIQFTSKVPA